MNTYLTAILHEKIYVSVVLCTVFLLRSETAFTGMSSSHISEKYVYFGKD